jgi:hypothetical protein
MDRTFRLDGDGFDLEILVDYFHSSRTTVEKTEDQYFLKIEGARWTGDDGIDWSTAEDELSQINGIAMLLQPNFRPVTIAGIRTKDPATGAMTMSVRPRASGELRIKGKAIPRLVNSDGSVVLQDSTTEAQKILSSCDEHKHLARALLIYGALPHEWRELSMVVDAIEDHHGGEKELQKMDYCPPQLADFTSTANSWKAIKFAARHGRSSQGVEKPRIELNDAREVIRKLMENTIKSLTDKPQV